MKAWYKSLVVIQSDMVKREPVLQRSILAGEIYDPSLVDFCRETAMTAEKAWES